MSFNDCRQYDEYDELSKYLMLGVEEKPDIQSLRGGTPLMLEIGPHMQKGFQISDC